MACPDWAGERSSVLILATSTKSLSGLHQSCGRVFRSEFPTIVDLVDDHPICKRHWNARRKYYDDPETQGTIYEIVVGDESDNNFKQNKDVKSIAEQRLQKYKERLEK